MTEIKEQNNSVHFINRKKGMRRSKNSWVEGKGKYCFVAVVVTAVLRFMLLVLSLPLLVSVLLQI